MQSRWCIVCISVLVASMSLVLLGPPHAPTYFAVSCVLASILAALSVIDIYTYRLPDVLTLPLLAAGVVVSYCFEVQPVWWSAVSAIFGFCLLLAIAQVYLRLRERAGIGLGDAKLLAAAGAWLGAETISTVLLLASMSALLWAAVQPFHSSAVTATTRLPFGPFLAFGIWAGWLFGPIHNASWTAWAW